jgi:TonB family protein
VPPEVRVLSVITERVAAAQTYPEAARRRGVSGSLVAAFVVAPDGSLASAQVARSSGSDILDRAGIELLKGVFPVENDAGARLSLRITITYRLEPAP